MRGGPGDLLVIAGDGLMPEDVVVYFVRITTESPG